MLLSQAILLGSMLSKQSFGTSGEGRCALEAAVDVTAYKGLKTENGLFMAVDRVWPWTIRTRVVAPSNALGCNLTESVVTVIWMLNDIAKWTRPRIAAWVASIEPPESLQLEYKPTNQQEVETCTA